MPLVLADFFFKKKGLTFDFISARSYVTARESESFNPLVYAFSFLLEVPLQLAVSPPLRKLLVSYH